MTKEHEKLPARRIDDRELAIEAYTKFLNSARSDLAQSTRRKYAGFVDLFVRFLRHSGLTVREVSKDDLDNFQKSMRRKPRADEKWRAEILKGYSEATQNLMISALSSFFKLANREGLADFFPQFKRIKLGDPEIKHLYLKEVAYFMEYLRREASKEENPHRRLMLLRLNAAIFGYLGCGARVSELLSVRWKDIKKMQTEEGKKFWTIRFVGKGNVKHTITLSPSAISALNQYRKYQADYFWRRWEYRITLEDSVFLRTQEQVMTDRGIRKAIGEVYKKAKAEAAKGGLRFHLKSIHPHLFRHTVGTQMRTAGADLATIQTQLGHSSSDTTSKYYVHKSLESVAEAVSKMDRNFSKKLSEM